MTALNLDDLFWLTLVLEAETASIRSNLTNQRNVKSPDEINQEVKNQFDNWLSRLNDAYMLLGGSTEADEYFRRVERKSIPRQISEL